MRLTCVVLMLALFTGCEARPGPEAVALQAVLERVRAEVESPGAILGVQVRGHDPIVVAVGSADLAGEPLSPERPFFLGSISKSYTAAVVLRLVETGAVALQDPLGRWVPGFPRGDEIQLRHLLDHTSGLKDFYSYIYFRPDREEMVKLVTKDWTESELLDLAGRLGHWFDPGTDWSYSNTNYYLLAVVIERATGASLAEAYRTFLYEPLSVRRTWLTWHEDPLGDLVPGFMGPIEGWEHSEMFGELGPTARLDRSPVEWGAGGLAAPAIDALAFLGALMHGQVLSASTLALMTDFRPTQPLGVDAGRVSPPDSENGYGLGLVRMLRGGVEFIGHGGLFTGHTAGLWYVPECDATISLYFNRGFVGQRALLDEIVALLADGSLGAECQLDGGAP